MTFSKRLSLFALACLLTLTACGGTSTPPAEGPDAPPSPPPETAGPPEEENVTLYDLGGLQAALPNEYLNLLRVDTDFPDGSESWKPLISVYEKASYEAAEQDFGGGAGFLFGFLSMDQAALEQHVNYDGDHARVFAADGERYYALTGPTDVQFYRPGGEIDIESEDWKLWEKLNELGPRVQADFLDRNGLQPFTVQDFLSQRAEEEDSVCLRYYPYFVKDGDTCIYYQLLLRQPARQGEGGIWAVDRWIDKSGSQSLYFPDSGKPAAEHYAELQEQCDAGEHPELLAPAGAAAAFVTDYFGHETVDGSFEEVPEVDYGYVERNEQLHRMVLGLISRPEDVDGMDLLSCVGEATADNWGVLGRWMYGSDWFGPLMEALAEAAVGEDQQRRDSMVISCFLATGDAQADFRTPLSAILKAQFDADSQAFLAALREFSEAEQLLIEDAAGFSTHLLGAVVPDGLTGAMSPPDTPEYVCALPEAPEIS